MSRVPAVTQSSFLSLSQRPCESRWVGSEYSAYWGELALQHSVVQIPSVWPPQLSTELRRTTVSVNLSSGIVASNHATSNVFSVPFFLFLYIRFLPLVWVVHRLLLDGFWTAGGLKTLPWGVPPVGPLLRRWNWLQGHIFRFSGFLWKITEIPRSDSTKNQRRVLHYSKWGHQCKVEFLWVNNKQNQCIKNTLRCRFTL